MQLQEEIIEVWICRPFAPQLLVGNTSGCLQAYKKWQDRVINCTCAINVGVLYCSGAYFGL